MAESRLKGGQVGLGLPVCQPGKEVRQLSIDPALKQWKNMKDLGGSGNPETQSSQSQGESLT